MRGVGRLFGMLAVAVLALQLFFLLRIALMLVVAPESTSFQRSEIWRIAVEKHQLPWAQESVPGNRISDNLRRAVIASEDAGFVDHHGVEWGAVEKAWNKNEKAEARVEAQQSRTSTRRGADGKPRVVTPKVVGGSTISQQLAKNLFLSGERNILRKGQELVITYMLEIVLGKQRILTTYLNSVEWGEGVFGAQAASEHYFRTSAATLGPAQAARLAVMLPAPKKFERSPASPYVLGRSATIVARMGGVDLP
ncbi:transglycosylase domain-containing protein [Scleromatobacter humisilvae]|uniref:Biosynthetic peptidoglycan transglycosylase n=1 Tax=Scleromatobacter humisilvae TaxID=2897159 RepID=A0A9X1YLE0_9BURK|nr:transglycosylase domain-containing protein [Scleromatobacter humisilvae]MCK9688454.1 transglycosylase domain-containing protein [Scleromatobacter humisilvae]